MEPKFLTGDQARRDASSMTTVTTPTGERIRLDQRAVAELGTTLRGELVGPGDRGYDAHRRVWNGSIDRHPALIVRCAGVADVIDAIRFARRVGLTVAVRSGGHSFPGLSVCDGGLVIDLSLMKGVRVDLASRTVRAQAGVRLGELDRETQAFGLAVPAGIVTHTGLAGLTLGGGIGWLMRRYGLTIDQLLSVDLVTADGELVKASATENSDLFWGIRGAGGNFGIVTEFEFQLNPVGPEVLAGPVIWPMEQSAEVLRFYRDWITDVPDELTTVVVHRKAPPLPVLPSELHGRPIVTVVCCYAGPVEDGERVVRPLKAFGSPLLDLCTRKPFVEHQAMFDASFPEGWWYYFRLLRRRDPDRRGHRHHRRPRPAHPLSADGLPDLSPRRGGRARRRRRDGLQRANRRAHLQHQRHHRDPGRLRGGARVVAQLLVGPPALPHRRLRQLPDGRGGAADPRRLRHQQVRPVAGAETQVRPGQLLPPQPEHPARLASVERPEQKERTRQQWCRWSTPIPCDEGTGGARGLPQSKHGKKAQAL